MIGFLMRKSASLVRLIYSLSKSFLAALSFWFPLLAIYNSISKSDSIPISSFDEDFC